MEELNPKQSGQFTGSAHDVVLLQEMHGAANPTHIVIHHLPPAGTIKILMRLLWKTKIPASQVRPEKCVRRSHEPV